MSYTLFIVTNSPTFLQQLSFPLSTQSGVMQFPHRFPSLQENSARVEQARLPVKRLGKARSVAVHRTTDIPSPSLVPFVASNISSNPPIGKLKSSLLEVRTPNMLQWQLQIVCGPGHDHNNIESQRPATRFRAFELIGEQIWRPTTTILDEEVRCPETDTSLEWSDFLRFRVLEETTPWEHWYQLYAKEHFGQKPLMRDCYITHGWNKQSKTPIWLPREVRDPGTLRSILLKWFPTSKDKVTIVFEFINKDHIHTQPAVTEQLRNLSLELLDNELTEPITLDSDSPIPLSQSYPSSSQINSSPPVPTLYTQATTAESYSPPLSYSPLASSSDSEFPSIKDMLAVSDSRVPNSASPLPSITLCPRKPDLSSSPLSTIPDSPQMPATVATASPPAHSLPAIPLRSLSKVSNIHPNLILPRPVCCKRC